MFSTGVRNKTWKMLSNRRRTIEELSLWPFRTGTSIVLDVSEICNQQCIFCDVRLDILRSGRRPRVWDFEKFQSIVHRLAEYDTVVFAGAAGEPLLNRNLPAMLRRLKKLANDTKVEIFTNGKTLTPKVLREVLQYVDVFRVSMCASTPETHSKLVNNSNFSKIINNLRHLQELKPSKLIWYINFIGMQCNIHELPDIVNLASQLGARGVYLQTLSERGDSSVQGQCLVRQPDLLRRYWSTAFDIAKKCNVTMTAGGAYQIIIENRGEAEVEYGFDEDGEPLMWMQGESGKIPDAHQTRDCTLPFYRAVAAHDGSIAPCCSRTFVRTNTLNIFDYLDMPIGQTDRFISLRKALLTGKLPEACVQCKRVPIMDTERFVAKMTMDYNVKQLQTHFISRNMLKIARYLLTGIDASYEAFKRILSPLSSSQSEQKSKS